MRKKNIYIVALVAVVALPALWVLLGSNIEKPKVYAYETYCQTAEEHEKENEWDLARAAWLYAKANVDPISNSLPEVNGRKAYCEYRIAMTYEREGHIELAIAHIQQALATPAADINCFMGNNGAEEMAKDLSSLIDSTTNQMKD